MKKQEKHKPRLDHAGCPCVWLQRVTETVAGDVHQDIAVKSFWAGGVHMLSFMCYCIHARTFLMLGVSLRCLFCAVML